MKKRMYVKNAITSMVMAAALSLPMAAMASEPPAANAASVMQTEESNTAEKRLGNLTAAEEQELNDLCRRREELWAELEQLAEDEAFADKYPEIESQLTKLDARIAELTEKTFPDSLDTGNNTDEIDIAEYVNSLENLTPDEKQELSSIYAKLDGLTAKLEQAAKEGKEYTEIESQIAVLENRMVELEEKAFPTPREEAADPAVWKEYADKLDLTDSEKEELVNAYLTENNAKIFALELSASVNNITKLSGNENQEYADTAKQLRQKTDEIIQMINKGADEEQLDKMSCEIEVLYDRMIEMGAEE